MREAPTKAELYDWFHSPITQHFFDVLKSKREGLIEVLAYGTPEVEKQHQLVGRIAAFTDILNTSYEDE